MRKRIKTKILLGFLVVIAMLAAAGGVSIYEFARISGLVQALIKDNYKTINAGKTMLEALERQESGVLLLLLGQFNQGSVIIRETDSTFQKALLIAENNLTEEGEQGCVETIRRNYQAYLLSIDKADDKDTASNLQWYQHYVHEQFIKTRESVNALINLNQEAMFSESTQLEQQSKRALMPGIIAISASLIFLLLLNFFISRFFVRPIVKLTAIIHKYRMNPRGALVAEVDSEDEIKDLAMAVEKLVDTLKE